MLGLVVFCATAAHAGPAAAVSCTLSASGVAFGSYNAISKAEVDVNGTLTLTCTGPGDVDYAVSLSAGQSGDVADRALASGVNRLTYQIYADMGHTKILGDGTAGTVTNHFTTTFATGVSSRTSPVYGVIPGGQNPKPGYYSDTVTVLVTY